MSRSRLHGRLIASNVPLNIRIAIARRSKCSRTSSSKTTVSEPVCKPIDTPAVEQRIDELYELIYCGPQQTQKDSLREVINYAKDGIRIAVNLLMEIVEDHRLLSFEIRQITAEALAKWGGSVGQQLLIKMAAFTHATHRLVSAYALRFFPHKTRPQIEALRSLLDDYDETVRIAAKVSWNMI